ncbi:hypothetical protein PACTADRAFT_51200 [Pachysolen tannophilus NRRL Y-2460]|uniref:Uncharacterized protein n=1 Tax=Pachysolen tannophilus NRRL Y-2460 TaxID=669874 RepID=A0A1E4TRI8_PACTA|nr:hypothetical protein PACTADRAFT_51200 [Pachysolen tannophilus NRRL Y-2460]
MDAPNSVDRNAGEYVKKMAVEFYDLDHELTKDERIDLSLFYNNIWTSTLKFSYLGFLAGISIPFGIKYYKTGSINGVNFLRASFGGVIGMIIVPQVLSPYYFRRKMNEMKISKGESSNEVQIISRLPYPLAFKWWTYYKTTATDPSKAMPDPRRQLDPAEADKLERRPGFIGASGDLFGLKRKKDDDVNERDVTDNQEEEFRSHSSWDRVRRGYYNGEEPTNISRDSDYDSEAVLYDNEAFEQENQRSEPPTQFQQQQQQQQQQHRQLSAWEKVRQQSLGKSGNIVSSPVHGNSIIKKDGGDDNDDEGSF